MKKVLFILILMAGMMPSILYMSGIKTFTVTAQSIDTVYGWKTEDVEYLRVHKDELRYKNMQELYTLLSQKGMEIRDVWSVQTSPWVNSDGKSYVRGLCIYSLPLEDLSKGDKYYRIGITLNLADNDTTIRYPDFWHTMDPNKSEILQFVEKTSSLPIREIDIRLNTAIGK